MKKTFLTLFVLSCSYSFSQTDYSFVYNSDAIIEKGALLYDEKKYNEAIVEFDRINKTDPDFLKAQYEKALALSALEKKEELKLFLEDLYKRNLMTEYLPLFTIYGTYLSNEKEYDQSEIIFKEGEKHLSNSSNFLYNFAILYYKKNEFQKCIDLLKRVITNDPNHSSSHYLLGAIAIDNGKIVEATLAMMSYLMISPNGQFAEKAILNLNAKFGENYLGNNKFIFSKTGDNFEEIEVVLRNQLPLKSAYKVKSVIDDVVIRQIQAVAEYTLEHKLGDGFFETIYIPWIKDLIEKNQFEGYSYHILQSMEERIGKKLTSKKKVLAEFNTNYVQKDFWGKFAKRKLDHFGSSQEVIVFLKEGVPYLIGQEINDKSEGKFKYLNENGNLAGELNFKDNELEGVQRYFDKKGNLNEEKTFKNGKVDGTKTIYYSNGLVSSIENYKEDKLDGLSTSFYVNGGKECEINYSNGELDGTIKCYFINGNLKYEKNYSKGILNGLYSRYNEVGDLIEKYNFVNNLIDGKYVEYRDGKTIETEANYSNGKVQDSYKSYYKNSSLEKEYIFSGGKLKKSIEYFENGKKSTESIYNDKEDLETYSYFDCNDNKFFEEKYSSGKLKSGIQYTKQNPNPVETSLSNKLFVMKDFEGNQLAVGNYEKDKKTGQWNHYYSSGLKRLQENYVKGIQTGLSYKYKKNGLINEIMNYTNDTINGLYEVYNDGILDRTLSYENGIQNGPYKTFYKNGKLESERYLIDGKTNYELFRYRQDGSLSKLENYIDDAICSLKSYNLKGELENNFDYKNKTGSFTFKNYNGTTSTVSEYLNGELHGKLIEIDKLNYKITETNFVNGVRHNTYKDYSPLGTLYRESNYYNGKLHGADKVYDIVGNLRYYCENVYGENNGKLIRYYHNKNKFQEANLLNGILEGDYTYYNQKGEPILIIGYVNDKITHYFKKNKAGELKDKIVILGETAEIVSTYPNGNKAIQINFDKGKLEGKLSIFSELGKPEYEANYINDELNGNRVEYYSNGNVYKSEHFIIGNFDGQQEFFKEDAKPWLKADYKNDELHGNVFIYSEGKIVLTKKYNSDELVEIIK